MTYCQPSVISSGGFLSAWEIDARIALLKNNHLSVQLSNFLRFWTTGQVRIGHLFYPSIFLEYSQIIQLIIS
jgi:hypothetical protein